MKSRYQIQFDFQNALAQANRLNSLADQIERRVVRRMDDVAQDINAAWKGDSARKFIGKEQALRTQVQQTARELRNTADDITRIARRIYNAEMQALRIAQERKS